MPAMNILEQAVKEDMSTDDLLRSIDDHLVDLLKSGVNLSQSSLNDLKNGGAFTSRNNTANRSGNNNNVDDLGRRNRRGSSKSASKMFDEFTDNIESQLAQAMFGAPIKDKVSRALADFATDLGWSIDDLGKEAGKMVGNSLANAAKNTKLGQDISARVSGFKESVSSQVTDIMNQASANLRSTGKTGGFTLKDLMHGSQGDSGSSDSPEGVVSNIIDASSRFSDVSNVVENLGSSMLNTESLLGTAGSNLSGIITSIGQAGPTAASLGPMLGGLGSTVASAAVAMGPYILAVGAAAIAVEVLSNAMAPAIEGFQAFSEGIKNAANSAQDAEKKRNELAKSRMESDFKAMLEASFDVLEDATQQMLDSWDSSLQTITATQGYTKADVQTLLGGYAQRLRDEGLSSVISVADINTNLEKVLQSGLSGSVAEEFAYQATLLNSAVPTEDFFDYASTYASIAANAMLQGASQEEAISKANEELKSFASNLLYSSRELAGGFTTGLKNGSELLADATKIATASRTGDISDISGVLTSVSAIVGSVAPDLASELVGVIVDAATGGNSETATALRSLSGTGASNTAFLQSLASNPQQVFTSLFTNLAQLQSMSSDNFMEVADGLSEVFGISRDAFARVDFSYLAEAVSAMNIDNDALGQNMKLLLQGQTTSTAEQLRMQEINQIMIDEGLAYVLDNEAARAIQENMWEEQRHMESLEATYAVDLTGGSLELLTGLKQTVENIVNFLNPFSWAKKISNIVLTAQEASAMNADIKALLEAGKVGSGSAKSLYNLTTRGQELDLIGNYTELLTGSSSFNAVANLKDKVWNSQHGIVGVIGSYAKDAVTSALSASQTANAKSYGVSSKYTWDTVGKSLSKSIVSSKSNDTASAYATIKTSASASLSSATQDRLQAYLDTIQTYVDENKSYDEWLADASNYGIANVNDALSDYGMSEQDIKSYFTDLEAQKASEYQHERDMMESKMREDAIKWYEETWPQDEQTMWTYNDTIINLEETLISNTDAMIMQLTKANDKLKDFYDEWINYYVNHTAYSRETLNAYDVAAIKNAEKSETGDAVLALAQALTSNMVDLKDPTVQTNVLLSQILIVAEAIMQQNNNTSTVSLPTALSALGLGVTET